MKSHDLLYRIGTHPIRKKILVLLSRASKTLGEISENVGVEKERLRFHMDVLLQSGLVEAKNDTYALTEDGKGFADKVLSR
jgi:predicted transcriptional regulator